ncbi:unnamed protein product, partial [marine sediment metagenome]
MLDKLKAIMLEMNKGAKINLQSNPELAKVLIIATPEKLFSNGLVWTDENSQEKTLRHVVNEFVNKNCMYYVMIGEATVSFMNNGKRSFIDSIVITGVSREGHRLALITPFIRRGGQFEFKPSVWNENTNVTRTTEILNEIFKSKISISSCPKCNYNVKENDR